MKKIMISALLMGMTIFSASAEMTAKKFISLYEAGSSTDKTYLGTIIGAVYNGIQWAQTSLKIDRKICMPKNLVLTDGQLIDMLRRKAAKDAYSADQPYGLVILVAIEEAFPCSSNSN
jgi:hypothetical protein